MITLLRGSNKMKDFIFIIGIVLCFVGVIGFVHWCAKQTEGKE